MDDAEDVVDESAGEGRVKGEATDDVSVEEADDVGVEEEEASMLSGRECRDMSEGRR